MLSIISAPHGGGKTGYITDKLKAAKGRGYFLVPEQSHFDTERRLYKELGAETVSKTNITSFTKISKEILGFYNEKKPYADDVVREAVIQRVLKRLKPLYYPDSATALPLITEFQNQGVTASELAATAQAMNTNLGKKLSELAEIYSGYTEALYENFNDRPDDTRAAAELARAHGFFNKVSVFADGFDGFTGSQMKLLEVIMACGNLTLTIPCGDTSGYNYSRSVVGRLKLAARKANTEVKAISLAGSERTPRETILMTAPDVYTECDYVAATVKKLITKQGYSLSDIAIVSPDKALLPVLTSSLEVYGINAFTDIAEPIIDKPPVRFILTALKAVEFDSAVMMSYIKSGFVRVRVGLASEKYKPSDKSRLLGRYEINALEKAQEIHALTPNDWKYSFPEENKTLYALEPLRKAIADPLIRLSERLCGTAGDKKTEALADFLINELEVPATITGLINRNATGFKEGFQIDPSLNDEYRQLWDTVVGVLESMHAALKNYELCADDFCKILSAVFAKTKTARPPQVLDAVTIGDAERTHMENIRVLFVTGATHGVFPRMLKTEGGFTEDELAQLLGSGIELRDDRRDRYYRERYTLNKVLATPSAQLYISASACGLAYEKLEVSPVFAEQEKLKNIPTQNTAELPLELWVSTTRAAKLLYARTEDGVKRKLIGDLLTRAGEEKYVKRMDALFKSRFDKNKYKYSITAENALALLARSKYSPSSITTLNSCFFKYFCEYGLKVRPRIAENGDELNPLQRGNLMHYCYENILRDYMQDYNAFLALSERELSDLVNTKAREFIQTKVSLGLPRTERQEGILKTYIPHIKKMAMQMQSDMKVSKFRPVAFEQRLSITLDGITIEGIADRIDAMTDGGDTYINIIDYKTGTAAFHFPSLYYGLGWQVLLYMKSAADKKTPSHALYKSVGFGKLSKTPVSPPNSTITPSAADVDANRLEFYRSEGIRYTDGIHKAGDNDIALLSQSYVKATGKPKTEYIKVHSLTTEQNVNLMKHFGMLLKDTLAELLSGNIEAVPIESPLGIPCQYCDYKSICDNRGKREVRTIDVKAIHSVLNRKADDNEVD